MKNKSILFILLAFLDINQNINAQKYQTIDEIRSTIQKTIKDSLVKISNNTYAIIPDGLFAGNILIYKSKDGFIIVDDQWDEFD